MDADGLVGGLNKEDIHHPSSIKILEKLVKERADIIYPATVIAEAATLLQIRLNKPLLADQILEFLTKGELKVESVDGELLRSAVLFLDYPRRKHATLFDAVVAAVANKYHADAIFSFDNFYQRRGFKLARDLK